MSVTFSDTTPKQGGSNAESAEKVVDIAENANTYWRLEVDAAMNHLSLSFLISFCYFAKSLQIKRLGSSPIYYIISRYYLLLWILSEIGVTDLYITRKL
jgi:hypothetical protein